MKYPLPGYILGASLLAGALGLLVWSGLPAVEREAPLIPARMVLGGGLAEALIVTTDKRIAMVKGFDNLEQCQRYADRLHGEPDRQWIHAMFCMWPPVGSKWIVGNTVLPPLRP